MYCSFRCSAISLAVLEPATWIQVLQIWFGANRDAPLSLAQKAAQVGEKLLAVSELSRWRAPHLSRSSRTAQLWVQHGNTGICK